jgi:hypothetical protein
VKGYEMKAVTMSLVALLAINSTLVGADIETTPHKEIKKEVKKEKSQVEPKDTTVTGEASLHYTTNDNSADLFDNDNSASAAAVTLNVTHRLTSRVSANFQMVGFTDLGNSVGVDKLEREKTGAIINLANLSAVYGTTSFIAGRQMFHSPMIGSYNRLIAPSVFESYTIVDNSIEHLTVVGSYIDKIRANNSGSKFQYLRGDNYTIGAVYKSDFSANIWYYNVDSARYQQVYTDAGYDINGVKVEGQLVSTDYDTGEDSTGYGVKISGTVENIDISAAYARVLDRGVGMIETDSLYTSSHNIWASQIVNDSFKLSAGTKIDDISAKISYADYDTAKELDLILGYKMNESFSFDAIYTTTEYTPDATNEGALEFVTRYKF